MIIDCVEEYMNAINQKESLRPFLFDYPILAKDVNIMITHWNEDKTTLLHPVIDTFTNYSSGVFYYTTDVKTRRFKTETRETYEEAKSLAKKITPRD